MAITMRTQEPIDTFEDNDTEITLGGGKLLVLFFVLVILCGISLGVGYWLGRGSATQAIAHSSGATSTVPVTAPMPAATSKPGASQVATPRSPDGTSGDNGSNQSASANSTDLTFYQSVQQKDVHPQLKPAENTPAAVPRAPESPAPGSGYVVQIAALRHQNDAKLLSDTLLKQKYPVVIVDPGDKLFHVQVGPYADIKEAEEIRSRLISAGYNAFLKH